MKTAKDSMSISPHSDMSRLPKHSAVTYVATGDGVLRTARKAHHCSVDYDTVNRKRLKCDRMIEAGEKYVEILGSNGPYCAGSRYHAECAVHQGVAERK